MPAFILTIGTWIGGALTYGVNVMGGAILMWRTTNIIHPCTFLILHHCGSYFDVTLSLEFLIFFIAFTKSPFTVRIFRTPMNAMVSKIGNIMEHLIIILWHTFYNISYNIEDSTEIHPKILVEPFERKCTDICDKWNRKSNQLHIQILLPQEKHNLEPLFQTASFPISFSL